MPKLRDGYEQLATQVPSDVMDGLRALCARTGRAMNEEMAHALRRHLAVPPVVTVVTPELPPATVERPAEPPKRRGRKRRE